MLEVRTTTADLRSILTKMSLPKGGEFVFDPIAPTFHPNGQITLFGHTPGLSQASTFRDISISGIEEPTPLPIKVAKMLPYLSLFKDNDEIALTYNDLESKWEIRTTSDDSSKSVGIPAVTMDDISTTVDEIPIKFDADGYPLYKGGTLSPNIRADIDTLVFRQQIKEIDLVQPDPRIFHLSILPNNQIHTRVGDPNRRDRDLVEGTYPAILTTILDDSTPTSPLCSCAYALGFEEVVTNLDSILELRLLDGGPLFIRHISDTHDCRYIIAPAAI